MVVPAFGFSVGDFIAGVHLLIHVCQALRDTNKGTEEYHSAVAFLELLALLCQRFEQFNRTSVCDPEAFRRLDATIQACHARIHRFLLRTKKYECAFPGKIDDKTTCRRFVKLAPSKLRWRFRVKDDLAKLQAEMTPHLLNVVSFLQLCDLDAREDARYMQAVILQSSQEVRVKLDQMMQERALEDHTITAIQDNIAVSKTSSQLTRRDEARLSTRERPSASFANQQAAHVLSETLESLLVSAS